MAVNSTDYNKIPDWTGSLLTNGAFLAYAEDVVKVYAAKGFDNLALQTLGPQLQAAVNRFAPFVNRKRSYSGTETVTTLDATRDALWKSLYHAWSYLMQTDKSCALHAAALALKPVMDAYRGLDRHELAKETKEINGLQRELETSVCITALKETGLYKIAGVLFETNASLDAAYDARTEEGGKREADKQGETTPSLRKAVATLIVQCSRRVNSADDIAPTDATAAAIVSVNGLIKQYKKVAAQPAHNSGGDTPAPDPDPAPDGSDEA